MIVADCLPAFKLRVAIPRCRSPMRRQRSARSARRGRGSFPETYLIDKKGVIRFKQIGPVTPAVLEKKILPLVRELEKQS